MNGMTAPPTASPITADEFLHMPENRGAELVDGCIVEKSMGSESDWLAFEIGYRIRRFLETHPFGRVFGPENGIQLWPGRPNHVRKPDVSFTRTGKLPGNRPPKGWQQQAPDLVVEVVSPNDEVDPFEQKLQDYREAGIPLIWVILPGSQRAQVLTPTSRVDIPPGGVLDGGDILPGFTLSLAELFAALEG